MPSLPLKRTWQREAPAPAVIAADVAGLGSTGRSAEPGIACQLSELSRELQADLTAEALLRATS